MGWRSSFVQPSSCTGVVYIFLDDPYKYLGLGPFPFESEAIWTSWEPSNKNECIDYVHYHVYNLIWDIVKNGKIDDVAIGGYCEILLDQTRHRKDRICDIADKTLNGKTRNFITLLQDKNIKPHQIVDNCAKLLKAIKPHRTKVL